ncbi:MAG: hypothetical protein JO270_13110 [Acidobacteriaceae bacterium]|nr:hypothetical protein [Acidobacteriaceae bacterium]
MESRRIAKSAVGSIVTLGAILLLGLAGSSLHMQAQNDGDDDEASRIEKGFKIAPVPLNMAGKDRSLVGLGSYLVNAVGDCNGCHSSGAPPIGFYPFVTGKNPYFKQPAKVDPTVYLNGGGSFGTIGVVGTPTGPNGYAGPAIISRNLTPDKNGRPEGHTLGEFKDIIRHGIDFDHVHPTCTAAQLADIQNGGTPACIPTGPIPTSPGQPDYQNDPDGNLLQIMPWPTFSHMTDRDIEAIYEYLSAIPCIDNTVSTPPAGAPNELRNDCGK